jgi:hypothetical protein
LKQIKENQEIIKLVFKIDKKEIIFTKDKEKKNIYNEEKKNLRIISFSFF